MDNINTKTEVKQPKNLVSVWWDTVLRDWHLPPPKNLEFKFYTFGFDRVELNLDRFLTHLKVHPNTLYLIPGMDVLLATLIWWQHPGKDILFEMFASDFVYAVEYIEKAVSIWSGSIWPMPQIPSAAIEPDLKGFTKAKKIYDIYTNLMSIDEIRSEILGSSEESPGVGNLIYGAYFDVLRNAASLLCGWQGAVIDIPLMKKWMAEFQDEMEKEPSLLEDTPYQQRFRDLSEVYEAVLDDGRVHPSYSSDPFGREYAEDPHYQNFVQKPPRSSRSLIIAPKGKNLFYSDASAANLHPLAEIWRTEYANDSRSGNLASDLEDPFDIHFRTGLYIFYPNKFTRIKEMVASGIPWEKAAKEEGIEDALKIRKVGKDVNFAIPNGSSIATIQSSARSRGYAISEQAYERFRRAYNKRYPIERWLSGFKNDPIAKTIRGRALEVDRQPRWSSFRIQGTIADLFGTGIFLAALKEGMFPSLWIHDAVFYESDNIQTVEKAIEHFQNLTKDWFPATSMRFEIEDIGKRWGEEK